VYDFFDEDIHVIEHPPAPATQYIVACDYGTTNPCVFLLLGVNRGAYPNMWVEREYYYSSRETQRQKTDSEYAQDFIRFLDGIYPEAIYIDPSAASFKQELKRQGVENIRDAVNDVVPGIRFVSQLMTEGTLKICSCCTNIIKEFSNYVWDSKASQRGIDAPIKQNDHAMDALRYLTFSHFWNKAYDNPMTEYDATRLEQNYAFRL
jgi:phage terminase large subunit